MGLEVTDGTLSSLNESNPTGADPRSQGDNHLKLIKDTLKLQFPGANGAGFDKPIIATEDELNAMTGYNTLLTVEERFDALTGGVTGASFPVGTRLMFAQDSAPAGWGIVTDDDADNRMLRVVNNGIQGGAIGGDESPVICEKINNHSHPFTTNSEGDHIHSGDTDNNTHTHSANTLNGGSHIHIVTVPKSRTTTASSGSNKSITEVYGTTSAVANSSGVHTHTVEVYDNSHDHSFSTISTGSHEHTGQTDANGGANAGPWTPRYLNLLLCERV